MTCVPPQDTPNASLHLLKGAASGKVKEFLWLNGIWNTPDTDYGTKPSMMYVLGWRYVRPVEDKVLVSADATEWPTHEDGTAKTIGEMEPEEKKRVMDAARERDRERLR
jgi:hypothetical protein